MFNTAFKRIPHALQFKSLNEISFGDWEGIAKDNETPAYYAHYLCRGFDGHDPTIAERDAIAKQLAYVRVSIPVIADTKPDRISIPLPSGAVRVQVPTTYDDYLRSVTWGQFVYFNMARMGSASDTPVAQIRAMMQALASYTDNPDPTASLLHESVDYAAVVSKMQALEVLAAFPFYWIYTTARSLDFPPQPAAASGQSTPRTSSPREIYRSLAYSRFMRSLRRRSAIMLAWIKFRLVL